MKLKVTSCKVERCLQLLLDKCHVALQRVNARHRLRCTGFFVVHGETANGRSKRTSPQYGWVAYKFERWEIVMAGHMKRKRTHEQ